jgi:ketosteroid isomerase-like protein
MNQTAIEQMIDRLRHAFEEGDPGAPAKQTEAANVKQVQDQYRALARGDFAAFVESLADDIELEIIGPTEVPFVGRWSGRATVVEAVRTNFALMEDQRPEIQSVVAQGDTVVLVAREQGRYRPTGRAYDLHWVQVFTFRDGKLSRMREFFDSAVMLETVSAARG